MKKIFLLICLSHVIGTSAQIIYPGTPVTGTSQIIFDYSVDNCNTIDIPDAPARAFRDAAGKINFIASHYNTWRMTGTSFTSLTKDCTPVMTSHQNSSPGNFNGNEWIVAPYTTDGINIHALVHNEYVPCGNANTCWYNSITYASSADSGKTYTHPTAPAHLVAASPYQSPYPTTHAPFGIFGGSNIIFKDGYYYKMVQLESKLLQEWGSGVIRTNNLSDPTSWRGWDGTGYTVQFVNPYTQSGYNAADKILAPVSRNNIGKMCASITYNTYFEKYMVVDYTNGEVNGVLVNGFFYSLSDDLINWSSRRLILQTTATWAAGGSNYPSIIDHADTSRNFEYAGQSCFLYYTKWNSGTYDRDLIRIPVTFNKEIVSALVVNSTLDTDDKTPGDGICLTTGNVCTLRAAIEEANARPPYEGYDTLALPITFNISGTGVKTISPASIYSDIFYPVSINGYTQAGASENTNNFNQGLNTAIKVALDANHGGSALSFHSGNNSVKGLAFINGAVDFLYETDYSKSTDNNTVTGCFIGMEADGTTPATSSIHINNQNTNVIGGTTNAARNLIGGGVAIEYSENNQIIGNYIGTDASGAISSGTTANGVQIMNHSAFNTVGGTAVSERNLISGGNIGVLISGADNHDNYIIGNYIGVAKNGTTALGNANSGIMLNDSTYANSISNNIIADNSNDEAGIWIDSAFSNSIQSNFIGTDAAMTAAIGNGNPGTFSAGIMIMNGSANNMIGGTNETDGNIIANNEGFGIAFYSNAGNRNSMLSNLIYNNVELGIDIDADYAPNANDNGDSDAGPNESQNFPVLSDIFTNTTNISIIGTLNSHASSTYTLQYFANTTCDISENGEGKILIGTHTVTTSSSGNAAINIQFQIAVSAGAYITALATDAFGNTSEFSACTQVQNVSLPTVTHTGALTFCEGTSIQLTSSPADSYLWSNGQTTQSITVGSSGNYSVTTDTVGLTGVSAVTAVTVNTLPTIVITGGATTICAGGSTILTASGADTFVWTNGPSTAAYSVSPAIPTSYLVTGTVTLTGCSDTTSQIVVAETCTGIETASPEEINLFPNPTNGLFNVVIKNTNAHKLTIGITDIIGKEVFGISESMSVNYNKQIGLENIATGIYYIKLTLDNNITIKKLIIQ
ncbi:MAG: T9SS type A sorting domain-containing protein [Bacteroidota bacterium]